MNVSCILHTCTFLKCRDHYTSNVIVAVPMQHCNYYMYIVCTCTYTSAMQDIVCVLIKRKGEIGIKDIFLIHILCSGNFQ